MFESSKRLACRLAAALLLPAAAACAQTNGGVGLEYDASSAPAAPPAVAITTNTPALSARTEFRGVWITNVDSRVLDSRASIAEAMDFLALCGFNVVYPVVWNQGVTLYPSDLMEREFGVRIDPRFAGRDPLAEMIVEAHRVGLEVVPWFEYGFSSSYNKDGGPLLAARPQWKALDREGKLLKKNNFEWMNAMDPEVREFITQMVLEVAANYDVDGIQGDDRLPAMPSEGGYDPATKARYKAETGKDAPDDHKDPDWLRWRANILNDWLAELRQRVKAIDPNLAISMSPNYYDWSLKEYLQDSKSWTERELVESMHPQAYRYNLRAYQSIIDDLVQNQFTTEQLKTLAPGILINLGDYRIPRDYFMGALAYNRAKGVNGEVFFFYEGLRRNSNELAHLLRQTYYREPAGLPYRNGRNWRPIPTQINNNKEHAVGTWERTPAGLHFLRLASGNEGLMAYPLTVPAAGIYDVYTYLPPASAGTWRRANYHLTTSKPTAAPTTPANMTIDQANQPGGWTIVDRVELAPGSPRWLVVSGVPGATGDLAAGPVMPLLNRRHSPNTVWPDPF